MVDVFIRNDDERIFRKLKSQAASEGITLAEELAHRVDNHHVEKKGGAAAWLAQLKPIKLGARARNLTGRIDEIASEVALDDYHRYQRSDK